MPAFGTAGDLRAESTELLVYRTGLIRGGAGIDQLAYRVDVTNGADIREVVIVQANAGKVINRYSLDPRRACTGSSTSRTRATRSGRRATPSPAR